MGSTWLRLSWKSLRFRNVSGLWSEKSHLSLSPKATRLPSKCVALSTPLQDHSGNGKNDRVTSMVTLEGGHQPDTSIDQEWLEVSGQW